MKATMVITVTVVFFFLIIIPLPVPNAHSQSLPAEILKVEHLQAWGAENIAVDFGAKGVWNYNGAWIQLSRLNPLKMESWGGNKLAVDFGSYGLWIYDGHAWEKIA